MLRNYLIISLRTLYKYRSYTLINIAGLAVGVAVCLFIFFYIQYELSFDQFHEKGERIYRATLDITARGQTSRQLVTPSALAPAFEREFPEVESSVRLYNATAYGPMACRYEDRNFYEQRFYYSDSTVFDIFTFPLIVGDSKKALSRPNSLVISKSMAQKYFGDRNPIGEIITVNNTSDFEITGVMADIPSNSHLQFDFLASYASLTTGWARELSWDSANLVTYFLLHDVVAISGIESKIPALIEREVGETLKSAGVSLKVPLQPLRRIHLYWEDDIKTIYGFSTIACLILLIACINYMNLATARSAKRGREVGMRKVLGGLRRQIMTQFWGESALITLLAILLAIGMVELLMPNFNDLTGKQLEAEFFANPVIPLSLVGMGLFISLIAGSYPAFFLSGFKPVDTLKRANKSIGSSSMLRKVLVVFQFVISIVLIVDTSIVYNQLTYLRSKKLGFDSDRLVVLPMRDRTLRNNYVALKNEFLEHSNVLSAAAASDFPGRIQGGYTMAAEGLSREEYPKAVGYIVENGIIETLGLELLNGQPFPKTWSNENGYVYIVNQAALKALGWSIDEAIGRKINMLGNREGTLIGVVKDFHYHSLREDIYPLAMFIEQYSLDHLLVKIGPNDIPGTMAFLEETWQRLAPNTPFQYSFVDQEFNSLYKQDEQLGQIFAVFAGFAIFIACLGLLGLAAFAAEQRTKEIGVRKILGATVADSIVLISKDFVKLILFANFIAWPIAWLAMSRWLEDFAYREDISWWIFILAGGVVLALALLTVCSQAIRAAVANPVDSLRYE